VVRSILPLRTNLLISRIMANVSRYRQGYEDMKRELAEDASPNASIPERFVKGMIGLPANGLKGLLRNTDEDRGRSDALEGIDFDPFRHEREEKAREKQELGEEEAANQIERENHSVSAQSTVNDSADSSDLIITLLKLGFALAAFVVALMIVFSSLPFWLGGMLVGWLSGFCMGVLRAHRLGVEGLREAAIHEGAKSGKYVVSEDFLKDNRQMSGVLALPLIACALWCGLLAWPVLQIVAVVPWAGMAAAGASLTGLVLGGLWSGKGFRRSLAWCARCAHSLPGGADARWGSVGAILGCIALLLLALMGKALPAALVRDFGSL
jgi:hypothetical protein